MFSLKPLVELQVHRSLSEYITALVWSPVGNRLAIASGAGEVVLWQNFQETTWQAANDALGFSGEGQWLAAAGQAGAVMLWRLSADSPDRVETLTWGWIDRLQWHPHQPWLAYNCSKTVHIWEAGPGETSNSQFGIFRCYRSKNLVYRALFRGQAVIQRHQRKPQHWLGGFAAPEIG